MRRMYKLFRFFAVFAFVICVAPFANADTECNKYQYRDVDGWCIPCPTGEYPNQEQTACVPCPSERGLVDVCDFPVTVTTTELSSAQTFTFAIDSAGTFYYDCDNGSGPQQRNASIQSNCPGTIITCRYTDNETRERKIKIGGIATAYRPTQQSVSMGCKAITFQHNATEYTPIGDNTWTSINLQKIEGNLGAIFKPINGVYPQYRHTFQGCHKMVGPIPEKLFGEDTVPGSFNNTFLGAASLTGFIIGGTFPNSTQSDDYDRTFIGVSGMQTSCPTNMYREQPSGLHWEIGQCRGYCAPAVCWRCPHGSTAPAGTNSIGGCTCATGYTLNTTTKKCEISVSAGQHLVGGTPVACPADTYNLAHTANYGETDDCTPCTIGYTTNGETGATACVPQPVTCQAGEYLDASGACTPCPTDTYNDMAHTVNYGETFSCTPCAVGYTTNGETGATACVPQPIICQAGEYLDTNGACTPCPDGFTSDVGTDGINQCYRVITETGEQLTPTLPTGCINMDVAPSCVVGTCTWRDYYGVDDEEQCIPDDCTMAITSVVADTGYYAAIGDTTCTQCDDGKTTDGPGATTSSQCFATATITINAYKVDYTTNGAQGRNNLYSTTCRIGETVNVADLESGFKNTTWYQSFNNTLNTDYNYMGLFYEYDDIFTIFNDKNIPVTGPTIECTGLMTLTAVWHTPKGFAKLYFGPGTGYSLTSDNRIPKCSSSVNGDACEIQDHLVLCRKGTTFTFQPNKAIYGGGVNNVLGITSIAWTTEDAPNTPLQSIKCPTNSPAVVLHPVWNDVIIAPGYRWTPDVNQRLCTREGYWCPGGTMTPDPVNIGQGTWLENLPGAQPQHIDYISVFDSGYHMCPLGTTTGAGASSESDCTPCANAAGVLEWKDYTFRTCDIAKCDTSNNYYLESNHCYKQYKVMFVFDNGVQSDPMDCREDSYAITDYADVYTDINPGYTVTNWELNGEPVAINQTFTCDADRTFTGHFTPNKYTVSFDSNGGNGNMTDVSATYDVAFAIPTNTFTHDSYEFLGWSTNANATTPMYSDGQNVLNLATDGTLTLYAVWQKPIVCAAGTYLPANVAECMNCPKNHYCVGGIFQIDSVNQGITECPENYPNSDLRATRITQCFSNEKQREWTGTSQEPPLPVGCTDATFGDCSIPSCSYWAYSNYDGTADKSIRKGCETNNETCMKPVLSVTADVGYYAPEGALVCTPCNYGYTTDGIGATNSNECKKPCTKMCTQQVCPNNAVCVHGNITPGLQIQGNECDAAATCTIDITCNAGYYMNGNECLKCPSGTTSVAGTESEDGCFEIQCQPGYTIDKDDAYSAEYVPGQCSRCRNYYGINETGDIVLPIEQAVESYSAGCVIKKCKYQGEIYNLENNECVFICPDKKDATGQQYRKSNRCVHSCDDGYINW